MVSTLVCTELVFDAGGATVAILGTPIDKIYPSRNRSLAERILEKGAIISEYPVGTETRAYHFLERNRIVTGLSDVIVIAEASNHSGTIRTAAYALEQGKELYVVPGDITRPMSEGCNRILDEPVHPYINYDDFVSKALNVQSGCSKKFSLSATEQKIFDKISTGSISGNDIAKQLDIDIATFNQLITSLEIKGVVRPLGCNQWMLV